jgi:hypothetical protein
MTGLIEMVVNGEKTIEEAEDLFEKEFELHSSRKEKFNWAEYLGIDNFEATAYANGASVAHIVSLRKNGWPDHCYKCHKPLDYKKYGWSFIPNESGENHFQHIKCPLAKSMIS